VTYVVDTHSLIWFLEGNPRLSVAALTALRDPSAHIVIPTIVLAEINFLHARQRLTTDLATVLAHVAGSAHTEFHVLDGLVAQHLPAALNIHDGIIVATALVRRDVLNETTALITKDAQITASGLIQVVW